VASWLQRWPAAAPGGGAAEATAAALNGVADGHGAAGQVTSWLQRWPAAAPGGGAAEATAAALNGVADGHGAVGQVTSWLQRWPAAGGGGGGGGAGVGPRAHHEPAACVAGPAASTSITAPQPLAELLRDQQGLVFSVHSIKGDGACLFR
jgi:hypothetical protein